MKKITFLFAILFLSQVMAQKNTDLESVIPNAATMVVRINGQGLTSKVGMKNISKSEAFLKLLEGEIFLGNDKKRVTEIGVNLQKDVYMFYKASNDMTYTAYLYNIEKPKLFAKYIAEKNEFVETKKGANYTAIFYKSSGYYNDVQDFLAWNNEYAIYVDVSYVRDQLLPEESEDRTENTEADERVEPAMDAMESVEEAAYDTPPVPSETIRDDKGNHNPFGGVGQSGQGDGSGSGSSGNGRSADYYKEREAQRVARQKTQDSLQEVKRLEKLAIVRGIYEVELNAFFGANVGSNAITKNERYLKSKQTKADLGVWVDLSRAPFYSNSMGRYGYGYRRGFDLPGLMSTFLGTYAGKDLTANLFFNANDISVESNIEFLPQISELLAGIYGTSIPKGYLKFINTDKMLGLSSVSMNTVKFWEAFPKVYAEAMMMSSYYRPKEKEMAGIRVLVDFMSIMMDEEALSKLVTGDAVFVLRDLVQKEVEYYSYEYDEVTYNSTRVKKTRMETYPDFLVMFGSKNKDFMTKLLDLGIKNEVLRQNGNYYFSDGESRDFPFQLYFTLTDEMAFISTNLDEIKQLSEGKSIGNMDKEISANILKNASYFNLNLPKMLSRIPEEEMSAREAKMLNYFKDNSGQIEWFNNFKDNRSESKMKMNTPSKFKNSALFVWDLIETAHQMQEDERKAREDRMKAREAEDRVEPAQDARETEEIYEIEER